MIQKIYFSDKFLSVLEIDGKYQVQPVDLEGELPLEDFESIDEKGNPIIEEPFPVQEEEKEEEKKTEEEKPRVETTLPTPVEIDNRRVEEEENEKRKSIKPEGEVIS